MFTLSSKGQDINNSSFDGSGIYSSTTLPDPKEPNPFYANECRIWNNSEM